MYPIRLVDTKLDVTTDGVYVGKDLHRSLSCCDIPCSRLVGQTAS